jgi:hypothetical protein
MRNLVNARRIAAAAAAPILMFGLVACGGDEKSAAKDPAAASSDAAHTKPSTQGSAGSKIDPQDFIDRMSASLTNTTTAKLEMAVSSSGLDMTASGEVDYTGDSPAMALKMTAATLGEGEIDMRLLDNVMFIKMPMIDDSGKFYKIDLTDPKNGLGSIGNFSSFDPKSTLDGFSKGVQAVRLVGQESLDGVETTHYRVSTLTKALSSTLGGQAADLPKKFSYEIWLDGEDRIRKMSAAVDKASTIEMTMSDFGDPVEIQAPPADHVQKMPGT